MKTSQVLIRATLFSIVLFTFTACQPDCNCPNTSLTRDLEENRPFKQLLISSVGEQVSQVPTIERIKFSMDKLPEGIEPKDLDIFGKAMLESKAENYANVEATELVTSIFNALIAAESPASQLQVKFLVSEKPVDNGNLIFALETSKAQELTLAMYDEEDFAMVANNKMQLVEGNNYKALNVSKLEPGDYILKLKDEKSNKELIRRIEIVETE